ncbi:hypothetical protein D3C86_1775340 [compost metagenome]
MISYKKDRSCTLVILDKKVVGRIIVKDGGFCYQPIGSKYSGEVFRTVSEVKKSLESDN